MNLNDIEGILFLSYLTDYNITDIHKAFAYADYDTFMRKYWAYRNEHKNPLSHEIVSNAAVNAKFAIERLKYLGITVVSFFDKEYPTSLKEISKPPPLLYVKGSLKFKKRNVAIIGSRVISKDADTATAKAVELFCKNGFGVISGLALGIDTLAHELAIVNKGYTVAVMPNPLDTIYPQNNYGLANKILDAGGALISEIPLNINRGKRSFVERNRIQSALSDIVMPIEMGIDSGTMHTIRFAFQQKKKVLLIKPSEEKEKWPEYEGINHLLTTEKANANAIMLNDDYTWKQIQKGLKNKNQIDLRF